MPEKFDQGQNPGLRDALKSMQSEEWEKIIREQDRYYRISFESLTTEGFSEDQAMELIKARGGFLQ